MEEYIINQVINNQLIYKIAVLSNKEDITALKSILLLPKKGQLVESFNFFKLQLKDKDDLKTNLSLAIPADKNELDLYKVLRGRYFNLKVHSIFCFLGQRNTWSYQNYIKSIEKGKRYEQYIFNLLTYKGYKIIHNCLKMEKLDQGIDFIGIKDETVLFIQCKNFENTEITHIHLKEFFANCQLYLMKNSFDGFKKRMMYISSRDFLSDNAKYFLKENPFIEFKILKYPA